MEPCPHLSPGQSAAKDLIEGVARKHGYLGEAVYARMAPDVRRQVEEALLAKDEIIGSSVMLLARELYSQDARFIFELLQNADDNYYETATTAPYVSFQLYANKVVIECNEDGFKEENPLAICTIGNSSKVENHGYIGEKGIGFKSVFKVAWKVHVQSGDFSFSFTHRPGQSGMGMISPEWENSFLPATRRVTRITLHLIEDDSSTARHESIRTQLHELECNMLLFLRKLERIDVAIYDDDDAEISSTTLKVSNDESRHRAVLEKSHTRNGTSETTKSYCHVTKHLATGLAKSNHRKYTAKEEASESYSKTEVILAFPLSEDSVPVVEPQQVFAFLPLRRFGFNFLIQTDFVTMINREDVVTSSSRNLGLLDHVAEAFVKAIHQMYEHSTLRYQWMRYIGNMKSFPWDPFWKRLVEKIENKLGVAEVMEPRRRGSPRTISQLLRIVPVHCDGNGDPLFRDLPETREKYISTAYQPTDLDILQHYGLQYMAQSGFLERVKYDLKERNSRMKNQGTTEDWHTRAAAAINVSFDQKWDDQVSKSKSLAILPPQKGRWISSEKNEAYFPTIGKDLVIPDDLYMELLQPVACKNTERAKLFANLGVSTADTDFIRSRILRKHLLSLLSSHSLERSYSHLLFLFKTHEQYEDSEMDCIMMYDSRKHLRKPSEGCLHFVSEDPHGMWQLSDQGRDHWFKSNVFFVHPSYFKGTLPTSTSTDLSWKDWLATLGCQERPRLDTNNGTALSPICLHIAENRPSDFLGFLKYAWEADQESMKKKSDTLEALRNVKVLCNGASVDARRFARLKDTYLPLPSLQTKCDAFIDKSIFPFLKLDDALATDGDFRDWDFLATHLGVGQHDNLQFYLDVLFCMSTSWGDHCETVDPGRILGVYSRIHSRCAEAPDPDAAGVIVSNKFDDRPMIYVPPLMYDEERWDYPSECLLDGPLDLQHKYPLLTKYKDAFPEEQLDVVRPFFRDILKLKSFKWTNIMDELKYLHERPDDFDLVQEQYKLLDEYRHKWAATGTNMSIIRSSFESDSLILVPDDEDEGSWVKPSECLWSKTQIRGRVSLNDYYDEDLEDFFVTVLQVPRVTVAMLYDDLCAIDSATATVDSVKTSLQTFCALLEAEEMALDSPQTPQRLLEGHILPVRDPSGEVSLKSAATPFGIVDRQPLQDMFRSEVKMLDFTLAEVVTLRRLFDWLGLNDRYLSKLARKTSVVDASLTRPVLEPVRDVKTKALALARIAAHLRSPRARTPGDIANLYACLQKTETLQTPAISATITLHLGGRLYTVELEKSEVCIKDDGDALRIYVPDDEDSQDVCFGLALPEELVKWMARDPVTNQPVVDIDESLVKVVTSILGTRSQKAMQLMLLSQGIIEIDAGIGSSIPDAASEESSPDNGGFNAGRTLPQSQDQSIPSIDRRDFGSQSSSSTFAETSLGISTPISDVDSDVVLEDGMPESRAGPRYETSVEESSSQHLRSSIPFRPRPVVSNHRDGLYRILLQHVVSCARTTALPRQGACSVSAPDGQPSLQSLSGDSDGAWLLRECTTSFERDCKVGAAGELFVFELLKSLLDDFQHGCWKSSMRRLVTGAAGLAEHANIGPWAGGAQDEITDLVYRDETGTFTDLLIENGYLEASTWAGRKNVSYFLEVKSTFGSWDGPFFMSDRQYKLMSELTTDSSVYMIVRVFSMSRRSIGARIYVDPDRMREDGQLTFSTNKWTVTPATMQA